MGGFLFSSWSLRGGMFRWTWQLLNFNSPLVGEQQGQLRSDHPAGEYCLRTQSEPYEYRSHKLQKSTSSEEDSHQKLFVGSNTEQITTPCTRADVNAL